jgi:hypothetical protein
MRAVAAGAACGIGYSLVHMNKCLKMRPNAVRQDRFLNFFIFVFSSFKDVARFIYFGRTVTKIRI